MKAYIHPKRNSTLIQRKDGRIYTKNWVYFRSILRSDNDEKIWRNFPIYSVVSVTNITNSAIKGKKEQKNQQIQQISESSFSRVNNEASTNKKL